MKSTPATSQSSALLMPTRKATASARRAPASSRKPAAKPARAAAKPAKAAASPSKATTRKPAAKPRKATTRKPSAKPNRAAAKPGKPASRKTAAKPSKATTRKPSAKPNRAAAKPGKPASRKTAAKPSKATTRKPAAKPAKAAASPSKATTRKPSAKPNSAASRKPAAKRTSSKVPPYLLLAGTDIGSNAMRVVLVSARRRGKRWVLSREQALRLPVRIGADVFSGKEVSRETRHRLLSAMWIYRELIDLYEPYAHRACATSALREASNSDHVLQSVRKSCGIEIELIDGINEARLIYSDLAGAEGRPLAARTLHIDVGGGSTELILGTQRRILELSSFRIGTVRRMQGPCTRALQSMRQWTRRHTVGIPRLALTASGGNARQLYKLVGRKRFIDISELTALLQRLQRLSVRERVDEFSLRPDRADTIVVAAEIYLAVMNASGLRHLYIPRANLIGGILQDLANSIDPAAVSSGP